jgi:hypothetical protein
MSQTCKLTWTQPENSVRTSQETHYVSTTGSNQLMLLGKTVAVYCANRTEHIMYYFSVLKQVVCIVTIGILRVTGIAYVCTRCFTVRIILGMSENVGHTLESWSCSVGHTLESWSCSVGHTLESWSCSVGHTLESWSCSYVSYSTSSVNLSLHTNSWRDTIAVAL